MQVPKKICQGIKIKSIHAPVCKYSTFVARGKIREFTYVLLYYVYLYHWKHADIQCGCMFQNVMPILPKS